MATVEDALKSYERLLVANKRVERERVAHRANLETLSPGEFALYTVEMRNVAVSVEAYYEANRALIT